MRAVVLPAPHERLRFVEDHPEPGAAHAGRGEILEITACGVCHSDLHVVDGVFPSRLPMVLGHEVTGRHGDLGPVLLYAPWGCRHCAQCDQGLEMICTNATEAGLFADGGYAERMWVPDARYLRPLGDLDPIAAAPLACGGLTAYRAVQHALGELARLGPADGGATRRAMVIGAGGLGQFAIRYLRLLSDAEVVAVDLSADKRAVSLEIGSHEAAGPDDDIAPVDVVIDFIGAESTLQTAVGLVAKRGAVIVVGLAGGRIPFGFGAVPHEVRLMTSVWGSLTELDELIAFAHREPTVVQPVEVLALADAQIAHDRLRSGATRGRLVLVPS